ncbi:MerR family DNA-binding protein [Palleronia sp. LCG004]|uniref:MerR family DNA-binding protein n=1 Tax=Palleronia sp. LCG004 TaxID=3079304 RepID=UPI002942247F|nr:MerR family DNA-binding protein [Palleronia sp. LCG004]WOI55369.1 MerR family DNA-binding protein [Palleronia sp. LCG004]
MTIGEISSLSGLPAKTIRYYEQVGLVKPRRDPNGYRAFHESDARRLQFLARARSLGFSIEDCRRLISLREDETRLSADVKALAQEQLATIDAKIAELEEMRGTLGALIGRCAGDDRPDCAILESFAQGAGRVEDLRDQARAPDPSGGNTAS